MLDIKTEVWIHNLLEVLKKNKEAHIADYNKAVEVYQWDLQQALKDLSEKASGEDFLEQSYKIDLIKPINQEKEYDKYIGMLEMSEKEYISLSVEDYECMVLDDWSWMKTAKLINSSYSAKVP